MESKPRSGSEKVEKSNRISKRREAVLRCETHTESGQASDKKDIKGCQ